MQVVDMIKMASAAAVLLGCLAGSPTAMAQEEDDGGSDASASGGGIASQMEQGKTLAFDRKKGNCLACHQIAGGSLPGTIGPPLIAMSARYADKQMLRDQIWDATKNNPNTPMPPFGKHSILTDEEIDLITEFIHAL